MKEFVKDYGRLCKESVKFGKKHWKGVVILNAALIGAELVLYKHGNKLANFSKKTEKEEEAHY